MLNPLDLTGRVILVTGASSGIGRQTAILLSQLGARTIITGRDPQRLSATLASLSGDGHRVQQLDLAQGDAIPKWVRSIVAEFGPLGGIVHAAGKQVTSPIRSATDARIDDVLHTNLNSAILLASGLAQKGCAGPSASLVFISSVIAFSGNAGLSLYGASKAALIGATKSLALELAPQKIRVNSIAPAFVETEMLASVRDMMTEEQYAQLEARHPLGFGKPEDVAHAAAFLLADTARWITGTTLVVDGGYSSQ